MTVAGSLDLEDVRPVAGNEVPGQTELPAEGIPRAFSGAQIVRRMRIGFYLGPLPVDSQAAVVVFFGVQVQHENVAPQFRIALLGYMRPETRVTAVRNFIRNAAKGLLEQ